jgi:alginate O-acetyltransferase complex protein AlgJ
MTEQGNETSTHAAKQRLSREEVAAIEVGHTDVSPTVARFLAILFLLVIVAVPAVQNIHEFRSIRARRKEAAAAGKTYTGRTRPQCFDGLMIWPTRTELAGYTGFQSFLDINARMLKEINEYEDRLEDNSVLQKRLIPPTQYVLTGWFGAGNEKAYCGSDGWLFFRPGIDYVTGRGFLKPAVLTDRLESGNEYTPPPQPDPVKAIGHFKKQLEARGITLIVMPTPVKPMVYPEQFVRRFENKPTPLQNPSFPEFKRRLEAEGIRVFDCAALLVTLKAKMNGPVYLAADTHWTPEAMRTVAGRLARFIRGSGIALPEGKPTEHQRAAKDVHNLGDIAVMLKLPSGQPFYEKQQVTTEQVLTSAGKPWQPDEKADVLVLGDSFSNIYSLEGMNWGESAGFVEHLSAALQRPVDRIVINDNGAFSTRLALAQKLARGEDRLSGKKVVIWQFAARELSIGDWKILDMKLRERKRPAVPSAKPGERVVKGRIAAIPTPPRPGKVPYKDAIFWIHLTDLKTVKGDFDTTQTPEILAYMWVMRDDKLTPVADYKSGQTVTLRLKPWQEVQSKYRGYKQLILLDPEVQLLDVYWGEE